jgi:hypothetical protein
MSDDTDTTPEAAARLLITWLDQEAEAMLGPAGSDYSREPLAVYSECRTALRALSARVAELEAERDEALNQLDSERHARETIERRAAQFLAERDEALTRAGAAYEVTASVMSDARANARADERRRVLEEVSEAWSLAIENGVASLNQPAAEELKRRYPHLVAFCEWLGKMEGDG